MLSITSQFDFLVGAAIGAVLLSALVLAPVFRTLVLTTAAGAVLFVYFSDGAAGLLYRAHDLRLDVLSRPDFAKGIAVGMLLAGKLIAIARFARPR